MTLRIAVPNKGRLAAPAVELLGAIGLPVGDSALRERRLHAKVGDRTELLLARASDIPQYVASGAADVGITGTDLLQESGAQVERLLELGFGSCRLALAVPSDSPITSLEDVPAGATVATSFPKVVTEHFAGRGVSVEVIEVAGAAEVTPRIGVADVIVDLVDTGTTLLRNQLREVATLLQSQAELVGNPAYCEQHRPRVDELAANMRSVIDARDRRYLMANVPKEHLEDVRSIMPGLGGPTIMDLAGREGWVAMHAVVLAAEVNGLIAALRSMGATGILVVPIERMIP